MTVAELIAALQAMPQDQPVTMEYEGALYPIGAVRAWSGQPFCWWNDDTKERWQDTPCVALYFDDKSADYEAESRKRHAPKP